MKNLSILIRKWLKDDKNKELKSSIYSGVLNVIITNPLSVIANMIISIEKRKNITISIPEAI